MGPHSDYLDSLDPIKDFIDKAMLNVDSSGIGSLEIADQFLKRWRRLIWVPSQNI